MKIYFASDVHLGAPTIADHKQHEKRFVDWLDSIKHDADEVYLLGDIFDYWYEYKTVVPKGFVRFLAKLCELTDSGIPVHIFTGNHDCWMFDYLPAECGVVVHTDLYEFSACGKTFLVGHGDGVGNYDKGYMVLKSLFTSKIAQFFYSKLHPDIGGWIATHWSRQSRKKNNKRTKLHSFMGYDNELQVRYANALLAKGKHVDYFVFGHRHIVADCKVRDSRVLIIGDWIWNFSYAVFDGNDIKIVAGCGNK